jgi:hypothetical protein
MKKRYKLLLAIAALGIIYVGYGLVQEALHNQRRERNAKMDASTPFTPYEDKAGKVIALAREESQPFRVMGRTMASFNAQKGSNVQFKYIDPIAKFPSIRDCLRGC